MLPRSLKISPIPEESIQALAALTASLAAARAIEPLNAAHREFMDRFSALSPPLAARSL